MAQRLAVIGAGPKGAAIASKAAALRTAKHHTPPPFVDLYDPEEVGAAWRGSIGYTDGAQPLCTLAERDLGFPYDTASYGPDVAKEMIGSFSWQSFAINSTGSSRYREWVTNGRKPPMHTEFADYLAYAVTKADRQGAARLISAKVLAVDFDAARGMWRVDFADSLGNVSFDHYDGVVITGSGTPHSQLPGANSRVFDGRSFWKPASHMKMRELLSADPDPSVLIIGSGGTAAAVAYSFVRRGLTTLPITIVGREATLFARHAGPFEDRLFTDDAAWQALVPHIRKAFLGRTTAGVVWDYVLKNLVSDNITYECYSVRGYRSIGPSGSGPNFLEVEMDAPRDPAEPESGTVKPPTTRLPATVIVDARGFDPWGFVDDFFASSPMRSHLVAERLQIQSSIAHDLSICGSLSDGAPFYGGLHVPALGSSQGPASTNLMGLGWLSDRVLSRYCW